VAVMIMRRYISIGIFIAGVGAIVAGILAGEHIVMFGHAIVVCLSCIGLE